MDRIRGDECPTDVKLSHVPMWVQAHGLQIRAMNRNIGEVVGSLLGEVLEVRCDSKGTAIGMCIRIRTLVDINKPLMRWTTTNIEGNAN